MTTYIYKVDDRYYVSEGDDFDGHWKRGSGATLWSAWPGTLGDGPPELLEALRKVTGFAE